VSSVLANTRLAVYRGVTENALGDEVDDNSSPIEYTDWAEQRRNLALDPQATGVVGAFETGGQGVGNIVGPPEYVGDFPSEAGTAARVTRTATGALRLSCRAPLMRNAQHTIGVRVRLSDPLNITVSLRPLTTSGGNAANIAGLSLPAGVSDVLVSGVTSDVEYNPLLGGVVLATSSGPLGATLDASLYDIEAAPGLGAYFDGSTSSANLERHRWLGGDEVGPSVLETRAVLLDYGSLPASVIERTKRVQDPASGVWRSIPYLKARMVNPSLDIRRGDRVRDLRTGKLMTVDSITRTSRSLAGAASLTLDLTDRASA
jgi:hypothetical protein